MRVLYFGGFDDQASPRVRLLRSGLRAAGVEVVECRASGRALARWTRLAGRFFRAARGTDLLLVAKPGQRDVPLAWVLGRLTGRPVVHDFFASLYINEVGERRRVRERSLRARELRWLDRTALRLADLTLTDTRAHGALLAATFGGGSDRFRRVFVGAEELFRPLGPPPGGRPLEVLYCGTFIAFHGLGVILQAARILRNDPGVRFTLLGAGQELDRIRRLAREMRLTNLGFEAPIEYASLPRRLAAADICLGIFADSPTARAVIPKKVFAALACERPVVTADTPGIREALDETTAFLCRPNDARSLAEVIRRAARDRQARREIAARGRRLHERLFTPAAIGERLRGVLEEVLVARQGAHRPRPIPVPETRELGTCMPARTEDSR